jgi:hypothetical protein
MKATPLADDSIQIIIDLPEAKGILMVIGEFVQHIAAAGNNPVTAKALSAAWQTARELLGNAIFVSSSPTAHPDCPGLLKELDLRRDRLPAAECPRRYSHRSTVLAFEGAFEAGYRGWPMINPYNRPDCRRAWKEGYEAGEVAFQTRLLRESRHPVAYLNGFHSGYEGLPKQSPYYAGDQIPFEGQIEVHRNWCAGYTAGADAARHSAAA